MPGVALRRGCRELARRQLGRRTTPAANTEVARKSFGSRFAAADFDHLDMDCLGMKRSWLHSPLAYHLSRPLRSRRWNPEHGKVGGRCFASASRRPPGGGFANTEGGRKADGRRWRRTEGDRKVFAAGEPPSRIQSTRRQTPQTDLRRRPEGGWKVGGWYRRRCEGARLRRWGQFHRGVMRDQFQSDTSGPLSDLGAARGTS